MVKHLLVLCRTPSVVGSTGHRACRTFHVRDEGEVRRISRILNCFNTALTRRAWESPHRCVCFDAMLNPSNILPLCTVHMYFSARHPEREVFAHVKEVNPQVPVHSIELKESCVTSHSSRMGEEE